MTSFYLNSNRTLLTDLKQNSKEKLFLRPKKKLRKTNQENFFSPFPPKKYIGLRICWRKKKEIYTHKTASTHGSSCLHQRCTKLISS